MFIMVLKLLKIIAFKIYSILLMNSMNHFIMSFIVIVIVIVIVIPIEILIIIIIIIVKKVVVDVFVVIDTLVTLLKIIMEYY